MSNPGKKKPVKRSGLAVRLIDDEIVLTKTAAWTYVRLPGEPYEFLSDNNRLGIAERVTLALTGLPTDTNPVEAHLIITHRPLDVEMWSALLGSRVAKSNPAPGWVPFLRQMTTHVESQQFLQKVVYLGVNLGQVGGGFDASNIFGPINDLFAKIEQLMGSADEPSKKDEDKHVNEFRLRAQEIRRSLQSSHLKAEPVTAGEIAWLIQKPLWAGMDMPRVDTGVTKWADGEIDQLAESVIINGHRSLQLSQPHPDTGQEQTSHVATLAVSRFPDVMRFPEQEPWIHYSMMLDFPVEWSIRFEVVPPTKVHSDVKKTLATARDQHAHIEEAGIAVPIAVREQLEKATTLEYDVTKNRTSWVYARYRLRVYADTEIELNTRVRRVIEHYRDLGIEMLRPTGDQLDLLLESIPGETVKSSAYYQRQEVPVIAAGMPTTTSEVGDKIENGRGWVGPYFGENTSRMRLPVFYSPHVAISQNKPPGVAILGQPGGGKSFSAFTLAFQSALSGVWTIYIDPKADAKPMGNLPGLGKPQVLDLRQGNDGMLDPFSMGDSLQESALLALETLRLLLGGQQLTEERESALFAAVEIVITQPNPSLGKVVETLLQGDLASKNLGNILKMLREMPFARLCFAPSQGVRLHPEQGLTIVTLLGLDLPAAGVHPSNYSYENRLAVSVMYLLTRYARKLMLSLDKSHPKAIFIDEAWMISSTPEGQKLIPETIRLGRAHNTVLVLVTQNAADLASQAITNSLSTVLAFRATNPEEIGDVLKLMDIPDNEGRQAIRDLYNGECLMKDASGRVSRVYVDAWNDMMKAAFDTNPDTRGKTENPQLGNE